MCVDREKKKNDQPKLIVLMEVPPRFELGNKGFADLCLTTWPWHHVVLAAGAAWAM